MLDKEHALESNGLAQSPANNTMTSGSAFVFPGGTPSALTWARHAANGGMRVVGASSLTQDPAESHYAEWHCLPWVGDTTFASSLERCLAARQIDLIYSSHAVVWTVLKELLPKIAPGVRLEPSHPWEADLAAYREYCASAARLDPLQIAGTGEVRAPLLPLQLAALVRQFELTPGQ